MGFGSKTWNAMTNAVIGAGKAGARVAADTLYYGSKLANKGIGVYNALSGMDKLTNGKLFSDASAAVGKVANIAYKDRVNQNKFIDTVGGLMKSAGRNDMAENLRHTTLGGEWKYRPSQSDDNTAPPQSNNIIQSASQPHAITAQQVSVPQAGGALTGAYAPARRMRRKGKRTLKMH